MTLDLVYVVRPGETNEPLLYSLRSAAQNLPHGRVWIAGYKPTWVENVGHLPTIQAKSKYENSTANILTAATHPEVSDQFILMNDDFFVLRPVESVPTLHRGPLDEVLGYYSAKYGVNEYIEGARQTEKLLNSWGIDDVLSYELHVPMVFGKASLVEVLRRAAIDGAHITCLHKRTLYGNVMQLGGTQVADCKLTSGYYDWTRDDAFLSSAQWTWHRLRRDVKRRFAKRSPYETGGA
jgi:hypothetical protein